MITKEKLREDLLRKYNYNKYKIVGSTCYCPICGKEFVKKTRDQVFCSSRDNTYCKDVYHNFMRYGTLYSNYQCFREVMGIKKKESNKNKLIRVDGKLYPFGSNELEEALMNQEKIHDDEFFI